MNTTDAVVARAMTTTHFTTPPRSRRVIRASFADVKPSENSEGAGNAGRSMRPQPHVQNRKAHEIVTTVTPG
jgi:hypothetical protein